jgi:hypothetical protein
MRRFLTFAALVVIAAVFSHPVLAQSDGKSGTCSKMLSQEDVAKATGLNVGKGEKGPDIAGSDGSCVWKASDGTQIVVVLSNKQQMQTTMDSMAQTGGTDYDGLGTSAVGTKGIPETGGGYNLSFTDAKGGVAVSIPGNAGTSERTLALGKLIEERRSGESGKKKTDTAGSQGITASSQGQTATPQGKTATSQGQTAQVQ